MAAGTKHQTKTDAEANRLLSLRHVKQQPALAALRGAWTERPAHHPSPGMAARQHSEKAPRCQVPKPPHKHARSAGAPPHPSARAWSARHREEHGNTKAHCLIRLGLPCCQQGGEAESLHSGGRHRPTPCRREAIQDSAPSRSGPFTPLAALARGTPPPCWCGL